MPLTAITFDATTHLGEIYCTISDPKRLPRQTDRQQTRMSEKTSSNDEVPWTMKFEKEQFTGFQSSKLMRTRRLPEIYLVKVWLPPQQLKPIPICNSYVCSHPSNPLNPSQLSERDTALIFRKKFMLLPILPIPSCF
jgi:hypothetical protein